MVCAVIPAMLAPRDLPEQDIALILDVRSRDEYAREQIPGSRNVPLEDLPGALDTLAAMPRVILSCQSGNRARRAAETLVGLGLANVCLLEGGIQGWKAAGRPTLSLKGGISIMRQVQIIVGLMVLTGTFYPPLWLLAPIAGAGMLFAGLSNTCMMAVLLGKLPWNRLPAPNTQQCAVR